MMMKTKHAAHVPQINPTDGTCAVLIVGEGDDVIYWFELVKDWVVEKEFSREICSFAWLGFRSGILYELSLIMNIDAKRKKTK